VFGDTVWGESATAGLGRSMPKVPVDVGDMGEIAVTDGILEMSESGDGFFECWRLSRLLLRRWKVLEIFWMD